VWKRSKETFVFDPTDTTRMALAKIENGHNRPNASSTRKIEICSGGSGIFLQMDQSKGLSNNNFNNHSKVFSGKTSFATLES
jgi:hypothetical protein